jgi:hypothetical protein
MDQPANKLGLHTGMSPFTAAATRCNVGMVQGRHSSLEARVIATVRGIVVAALSEFAFRPSETLLCLDQVNRPWVSHREGSILQVSAQRKEGPSRFEVIHVFGIHRGRKRLFNEAIHALRTRVDRTFAWEDKFKRVLLRFEHIQQRHFGMKLLAYTLINVREFCGA